MEVLYLLTSLVKKVVETLESQLLSNIVRVHISERPFVLGMVYILGGSPKTHNTHKVINLDNLSVNFIW